MRRGEILLFATRTTVMRFGGGSGGSGEGPGGGLGEMKGMCAKRAKTEKEGNFF